MRIVILQGAFLPIPPVEGGAVEKMWYRLGEQFAQLGHQVTHISRCSGYASDSSLSETGVRHLRVRGYESPKRMSVRLFEDFLYSKRAVSIVPDASDVVITNTFWAPVLLRHHGLPIYVDVARMPKGQMKLYAAGVVRLRANSTAVADAIRRETPSSQHAKVKMIPNPLPFMPMDEVDLQKKESIILYCGRIHPEKGLDLFADAVAAGIPQGWKIKIVGPWDIEHGGGGQQYLDNLRARFRDSPAQFIGPVFDEAALNDLYKAASIFVYPSISETGETFGLAPLEAMAWGAVPVVSNLACFRDFINNGCNGVVFDHRAEGASLLLRSAILMLISSESFRGDLAKSAMGVRETHSLLNIAQEFIDDFMLISSKENV